MDESLIRLVRARAGEHCEYCHIPRAYYPAPFQIDHVIARKHAGVDASSNLALCCLHCNSHKGPNIAGIDPRTRKLTALFNPRRHSWPRHFQWQGPVSIGKTPMGRATIAVL